MNAEQKITVVAICAILLFLSVGIGSCTYHEDRRSQRTLELNKEIAKAPNPIEVACAVHHETNTCLLVKMKDK